MEVFYIQHAWNNSQPKESADLLLAELTTIGGSGGLTGGGGGSAGGSGSPANSSGGVTGGSRNATGGAVGLGVGLGVGVGVGVGLGTVPTVSRGRSFDLVIHNVASYPYTLQKATFESLWESRLSYGGVYVMEGLEVTHHGEGGQHQHTQGGHVHTQGGASMMIREIVAWAGSLLYNGRIAG